MQDPLHERESSFEEKLRAYTGIDPCILYQWTAANTEAGLREQLGIPACCEDPGSSVITQVLRDLPPDASESVRRQVWRLDQATQRVTNFDGDLRAIAGDAAESGGHAESAGHQAAHAVRHYLGLDGNPIEDVEEQLKELGAEVIDSCVKCLQERMLVGSDRSAARPS